MATQKTLKELDTKPTLQVVICQLNKTLDNAHRKGDIIYTEPVSYKIFLKTVQRLSHRYMTEALKSTVTPFKPSLSNPSQIQTSKNRCQQMQASSISFKKLPEKSGISQMTDLMISTMLSIQHKEAYHDIKSKRPKPAHPITTN